MQAKALANAVFAYASYIDDLGKLSDAIEIIAHRHVSFQVPKESYKDVGTELLKSIKERGSQLKKIKLNFDLFGTSDKITTDYAKKSDRTYSI